MKPPNAMWETTYAHDRRKHRHRCHCCKRILVEGDKVLVTRVEAQKTWAIHAACASLQFGSSAATWRDAMTTWGTEYLRACGWKIEPTSLERAA